MFTKAIVRPPAANYAEALTTQDLGAPDYARALRQHATYCEALEECGLTLTRLEADERYPDSTFVEDMAVIVGALRIGALPDSRATAPYAILTRPGAASRVGEVESIAEALSRFYSELHSIREPGTLDGGDVCEAGCAAEHGGRSHFFIGISERTNEAGAEQLAAWLAPYGCTSSFVDIRGLKNILHLKSGLAYLGDNRLGVIDALADHNEFRSHELVRVPAGEEYAANCVRANDRVLVAAGYPGFAGTLRDLGYQTIALEMTEFQKMDGGLSCLSLRF
jgi:dimethylargininase